MNHTRRLLTCLVSFAILMAAGCNAPATRNSAAANNNAGNASSPAPGNANTGGAGNAETAGDAQALNGLTAAINAQLNARSFRARMDSTFNGQEMARTIEYVAPDHFRLAGDNDETVIIGSKAWARHGNSAWQELPIDASRMIASVRDPKIIDEIRKSAEVKLVGPDTLDGKPMTVYQYTLRNMMGTTMTSHAKAWISTADNLPRRIETEAEINGQPSKATITYFDYNADIKIDPPK
jgi:pectate lyase